MMGAAGIFGTSVYDYHPVCHHILDEKNSDL